MIRRSILLLFLSSSLGFASAPDQNLIVSGRASALARFRAEVSKKHSVDLFFTDAERALLRRLKKPDFAETLVVRTGSQTASLRALAKRMGLASETDQPVKLKSVGGDPLLPELWALENRGDTHKVFIDNFTSLSVKGVVGEDVHLPPSSNEGRGMKIAILDSGFDDTHPDLRGQFAEKTAECANLAEYVACRQNAERKGELPATCDATFMKLDADGNGYPMDCHGWSAYGKKNKVSKQYGSPFIAETIEDGTGHGTKVAGVIGARAGNEIGVRGIAPQAKIIGVKVFTENPGAEVGGVATADKATDLISTVTRGMLYAIGEKANVINLSFGWNGRADAYSPIMREAVKTARENGIIVVGSAGNDSTEALVYPCAYSGVLCVGSHDPDGGISEFSNFGSGVDIAAPGMNILSTCDTSVDPTYFTDRQGYDFESGTSFAAPYVSGAAAILRSQGYSTDETLARLLAGARTRAYSEGKIVLSGNLDVAGAIAAKPRPYFGPENKDVYPVLWDRKTNQAELAIDVRNLWQSARNVQARLRLSERDRSLGQIRIEKPNLKLSGWPTGEVRTLSTMLTILDPKVTSDVALVLEISADGGPVQNIRIPVQISVALEKKTDLPGAVTMPIQGKISPEATLFSIRSADGRAEQDYYAFEATEKTWKFQIIREVLQGTQRTYVAGPVREIPGIERGEPRIALRVDVNLDGTPDYVFTTMIRKEAEGEIPAFRFDYRSADGKDILPAFQFQNDIAVLQLDRFQWLRSGKRLVPAWVGAGLTPIAERKKFDPWNPNALLEENVALRFYYHDPLTKDGIRSLPIPTDARLPKGIAYLSMLDQSPNDAVKGRVSVLISELDRYVAQAFAVEFDSVAALPQVLPIESNRYRNFRAVENIRAYSLDRGADATTTAFASASGIQGQRVTALVRASDRYLQLDQTVTPDAVSNPAYKTMAAFSENSPNGGLAAFIQANYDIFYRDSSTEHPLVTSLRRYTFMASSLFERLFYSAVAESDGERIPALQIPDGFGAYPGAEVIVPLRRNGKSVELIRPAALRVQMATEDCDWLARTDANANEPSAAVYYCGDRFIRLPYRF